jgi:hypothetical protein
MTRFRPTDDPKSMDDDIRNLMEDIDASRVDFERRLEAELARHARPVASALAAIPKPQSALPVVELTAEPEPAPESELAPAPAPTLVRAQEEAAPSFLAELEHEANARSGNDDGDASRRSAEERLLDETLKRVFKFFEALCRHSNTLAPTIKRSYRLDLQTIFSELAWQDASVRSRRQSLAEHALLDYVAFRVRLSAPEPLAVVRRWDQMEALHKEMHHFGLRTMEGLEVEEEVSPGEIRVRLAPDFLLQVTFRANYRKNQIDVLTRNFEDFGMAAFSCVPGDLTQAFLDDFARFLLDRSKQLPLALQRILGRKET